MSELEVQIGEEDQGGFRQTQGSYKLGAGLPDQFKAEAKKHLKKATDRVRVIHQDGGTVEFYLSASGEVLERAVALKP